MKKLKAQYKGLVIMLGSMKIDTNQSLTASEIELLARLKPEYVEESRTTTAKKSKPKASTANSGDESSKDGDTAAESKSKEAEE